MLGGGGVQVNVGGCKTCWGGARMKLGGVRTYLADILRLTLYLENISNYIEI